MKRIALTGILALSLVAASASAAPISLLDLDGGDATLTSGNIEYGALTEANLVSGDAANDSKVMPFTSLLLEAGVTSNYVGDHDVYGGTTVVNLDDDGLPDVSDNEQKLNNKTQELRWRGNSGSNADIGIGAFYFSLNSQTTAYSDLETITMDTARTEDVASLLINLDDGAGWYISENVGADIDLDASEIAALEWDVYTGTGSDLRHDFVADGTMAALGLESNNVLNVGFWTEDGEWTNTSGLFIRDMDVMAVPEPATMSLLAIGGLGCLLKRRRK